MNVKLNGKQTQVDAKTVLDLLKIREVEPQMVAVELNEKMVEREDFEKTPLHEGDRIELHYFMGGGGSSSKGRQARVIPLSHPASPRRA